MYCSSCGSAVKRSLRYCNHCGNELPTKQPRSTILSGSSQESIAWAIAAVTIVGLGGTIGVMAVMKEVLHFNDGLIVAFSLLFILSFLAADSIFFWLLWRSKQGATELARPSSQIELITKDLDKDQERALPEPAISITEHSTRNLEAVDSRNKR